MKELPKRKQNRLKDYDYSSPGAYFVTICTNNRKNLFEIETDSVGNAQSERSELYAKSNNIQMAQRNGKEI